MQAGSRAPSHVPSCQASVSLSRPRTPMGQGRSDPTSRPGAGHEQYYMMEWPVSQSPGPPAGLSHRRRGCAHTHTHKQTCACMSSHPCVCSGLGLPASLPQGAVSILGTLRRRAGGKPGSDTSLSREDPCPQGAVLGMHMAPVPGRWGAQPPAPAQLPPQLLSPATPDPSGNSLVVVLRLVERLGSEARPEPRR